MPFTFRKVLRFGPLRFNFGKKGFSSVSVRVGPVSHNLTTGVTSTDLPGPVNHRTKGRRRPR